MIGALIVSASLDWKISFANSLLLTIVITVVSLFYFALFYEAIPREQRGEGLLWAVRVVIAGTGFGLAYIMLIYITKRVCNFWIWISVVVYMSLGIIPGYFGLGWIYAIVMGIPWGATAYFSGKMEQERLNRLKE